MMKLVYIVSVIGLLVKVSFGGCHTGYTTPAVPRLGIRTTDRTHGGTNTAVIANIYSGGAWKGWQRLDNSGCDDFQEGAYDFFDDFEAFDAEWEAMALYSCGADGLMIESVYYWDGSGEIEMWGWDNGVFGPYNQQCVYNGGSDIWIKQIDCGCEGVVFKTAGSAKGSVWTGSYPGRPACSSYTAESQEAPIIPATLPKPSKYAPYINTNSDFEEKLVDYLMAVIGIAALLFVSNSCLITVLVKKNIPQYEYGKVYKTDME